jgi:hypothetical protein
MEMKQRWKASLQIQPEETPAVPPTPMDEKESDTRMDRKSRITNFLRKNFLIERSMMKKSIYSWVLTKAILTEPFPLMEALTYPKSRSSFVKYGDHQQLIIDQSGFNWLEFILGVGFCSLSVMADDVCELSFDMPLMGIVVYLLFWLVFIFMFTLALNAVCRYRRRYIFNREDGTLTYPDFIWFRNVTVPFEKVDFLLTPAGIRAGEHEHLAIVQSNGVTRSFINWDAPEEHYSMYVWFMDRNRPLPPGDIFDRHREEDYLRRKAEGFPPPLYESAVITPEWEGAYRQYNDTQYQQRERCKLNNRYKLEEKEASEWLIKVRNWVAVIWFLIVVMVLIDVFIRSY